MVASALFIMDLKGKIIISRNFRGDVPMSASETFRFCSVFAASIVGYYDVVCTVFVLGYYFEI